MHLLALVLYAIGPPVSPLELMLFSTLLLDNTTPHTLPLYSNLLEERQCAAVRSSKEGKTNMAASPQFADAEKAQAWQKLTDLQQHMVGLITAVEDQLSLSDAPKLVCDHRAAAVAEDAANAVQCAVKTQQQQEQTDVCAVTFGNDQQPHGRDMPEQLQTHTGDAETCAEGPPARFASSENTNAAAAAATDAGAEAAADAAAACSKQQVRAKHLDS